MLPARQIEPLDWMTDPQTERVMNVIGGYDDSFPSRFVGGCVRNTLLGLPVADIDIATIFRPDAIMEKLTAAGIRYIPTGLEHGTVTAIMENRTFEITSLRKDIATDGRRAVIAFSDSWEEDSLRRDFTINTLLATPDGTIFDPTGEALSDIDHKKVVFVGNADQRIREDYLRILRFFRFHAAYAEGEPDKEAMDACRANADGIRNLSRERITQEVLKILALPNPDTAFRPMVAAGILSDLFQGYDPEIMTALCDAQHLFGSVDSMARLLAATGFRIQGVETWLILSKAQQKDLKCYSQAVEALNKASIKKIRELVYRDGNAAALQGYFLRQAKGRKPLVPEFIDIAKYWQAPLFPVRADDLISRGTPRGVLLGQRLKELEERWIRSDFQKVPRF